jgi:hypothetical protein
MDFSLLANSVKPGDWLRTLRTTRETSVESLTGF